jgi:hypothetical protein
MTSIAVKLSKTLVSKNLLTRNYTWSDASNTIAVNVSAALTPKNLLSLSLAPNGPDVPTQAVAVITNKALTAGRHRLDALEDVQADTYDTPPNSTLVYDPATDKYVVKLLDLDGGTF